MTKDIIAESVQNDLRYFAIVGTEFPDDRGCQYGDH